jgi:hypothetical protein
MSATRLCVSRSRLGELAQSGIAYRPMGEQFGFFAESSRCFGKTCFKRDSLFESSALLHDANLGS